MKAYEKFEHIIEVNCRTIQNMVKLKGLNISTLTILYRHFLSQMVPVDESAIQCSPGCLYCCHMKVTASIPEILIILNHLEETGQIDLFQKELETAPEYYPPAETADDSWWVENRVPCLFLDKERRLCKIYTVRPFTCRGYHSLDIEACRKGYEDRVLTPIPCHPDLKRSRELFSLSFERAMINLGKPSCQAVVSEKAASFIQRPELALQWLEE